MALAAVAVALAVAAPGPEKLLRKLGADRREERDGAARRLLELGDESVPALEAGARSPDPAVRERSRAILELVTTGTGPGSPARSREAAAVVALATLTPGGLARGSAADRRLHQLRPEAGDTLASVARQVGETRLVPDPLAAAIGRHATANGVAAIVDLFLRERMLPSTTLRVARELEHTLGAPAARENLGSTLQVSLRRLGGRLDDPSPASRRASLALLAAVGGKRSVTVLARSIHDTDAAVRAEATRALGHHAAAGYASLLREMTHDDAEQVRLAALGALEWLPAAAWGEAILTATADESAVVRAAAARMLQRIDSAPTRGALERLAFDESLRVRGAARRSLRSLARD